MLWKGLKQKKQAVYMLKKGNVLIMFASVRYITLMNTLYKRMHYLVNKSTSTATCSICCYIDNTYQIETTEEQISGQINNFLNFFFQRCG